jgi:ATP-dependent exoDNAse (exonuclease V) beta subunit
VNFRSARAVVEWVNDAFRDILPASADPYTGAVPFAPSVAFREGDAEAGVTVHAMVGRDDAAEADLVLELMRTSAGERTAVLVRSRTHLAAIAPCLRDRGVRFRAIEIQALAEQPVVQDLLALTRSLLHLADRASWLSILRAPWCGLTLADLYALAGQDLERTIWELIEGELSELSADGRVRLSRVMPVLKRTIAARGREPVVRLVERAWITLGGQALADDSALLDARAFFDLLEQCGTDGDIDDFDRLSQRVQDLFANPDDSTGDVVELMTIHKAKGLEFDTVILSGMGRTGREDEPGLMSWLELLGPTGAPELLLAPIPETGADPDALFRYIRGIERARRDHEATRLLYVALTRARTTLHILGHARELPDGELAPAARSLLSKIWPAVGEEFRAALGGWDTGKDVTVPPGPSGAPLRRLSLDWRAPAPPVPLPGWEAWVGPDGRGDQPVAPSFDWAGVLGRRVGVVVHAILQRLSDRGGAALWLSAPGEARIRAALSAEGIGSGEMDEAAGRVRRALRNTLEDERGRWILRRREEDARELSVSHVDERGVRRLVLDRTFVEDGVRWIVDYKTGSHEGAGREAFLDNEVARYSGQLGEYARAMRCLDDRPIRLGLYFPLLRGWRECSL